MTNPSHSPGGTGRIFPDATLPTRDGGTIALNAFRPRWNLVIVMLGADGVSPDVARLLDAVADARAEVDAEEGMVLALSASPSPITDWRWPFPLLRES